MDEQVELLRAIRDEMRALNGRVDGLNGRIDGLNGRVDGLNGRVDGLNDRVDATNAALHDEIGGLRIDFKVEVRKNVARDLRLGTAVAELALDVRELTGIVHAWRDEHRLDREDLRERVARLERRVGLEPP